jgi:hypothetical protein
VGALSSVMSIAGAGLLPTPPADIGIALVANTDLGNAITGYANQPVVDNFVALTSVANAAIGVGNAAITQSTYDTLFTISVNNFPPLTDVPIIGNTISDMLVYGTSANIKFVSTVVAYDAEQIMGAGDLSKFCQAFMAAQGYITQANSVLNSVKNSAILAETFNPATGGMDTLSTGGLNQVSNNLPALSSDMLATGDVIYLGNLSDLGLPGELLAQIGRVSGGIVASVSDFLLAAKIPDAQIRLLGTGNNQLTSAEEKAAYQAMLAVTGDTLKQILLILRVRTPSVTNMAQLLDPKVLFPNSYKTLLCPTSAGLSTVYLSNGSINNNLRSTVNNSGVTAYSGPNNTNSLDTLEKIIPPDQALANKALALSLGQLKNVTQTTTTALSTAMAVVQTNAGLGAIGNLIVPVPPSVTTAYENQLGQGTGPNGDILLVDIIGTASGYGLTPEFNTVANVIGNITSNVSTSTYVTNLNLCYSNMSDVLGNVYGDNPVVIPTGPGAGTYTDWNDAFVSGLIPAANTIISNIATTASDEVFVANQAWGNIITSVSTQRTNQVTAEINFADLQPESPSACMSFASNLHDYGLDVAPGGANQYLESVAKLSTLSGQCVISSLREGRNLVALQDAGIQLDTQLSDAPVPGIPRTSAITTESWSEYSAYWSKALTLAATDRNWGLYRAYLGYNVANWGYDGTNNQVGTVSVRASGKNVDVIIVDAVIDPDHPELAVNVDGSGGSRFNYVNWYALNVPGNPAAGQVYNPPITTTAPNSADDSRHATFVAGIVAGNTQGWAPNANIYNISPQYVTGGVQYLYLYKYILAWHNSKRLGGDLTPTICNNSWYSRYTIPYTSITSVTYRGATYTGPFTTAQLLNFGITNNGSGLCIVGLRNAAMDADIQNCINAGIIMVACAGNDDTRISVPGDIDYNNTLTATGFNFGNPIYYARGSSPVASSNVICVGAIGASVASGGDRKASYSNNGPRINLFAPGSYVTSSWLTSNGPSGFATPVQDPRNPVYYIARNSGTSFSSPQVAGILTCALEVNPNYDQTSALNYIVTNAKTGQIPDSGGGYTDTYSLQGAPNIYVALPSNLKL